MAITFSAFSTTNSPKPLAGEKWFQLNPGGGNATICDDAGNWFQLDSKAKKLEIKNSLGSTVGIEGNKGWFTARESITCETKDYNVNCTNYNVKSSTFTHNGKNVGLDHKHLNVKAGPDVSGDPV